MTYPLKFRQHVLLIREKKSYLRSKRIQCFAVGIASGMRWAKKLQPAITGNKPATKINMDALLQDVKNYPGAYLSERAQRFGVSSSGIELALECLGVSRKKTLQHPKANKHLLPS